jgi:molybdopterin-containing oxidoreductase family iron-sulfur binding subunit
MPGKVETLIILGGNPAYNTPVDLRLDFNRLEKVKLRAHLHLYNNETSEICHWHINAAHYLESWGDARAYDGTASIVQPLIGATLCRRTAYEVLALFSDSYDRKPYEIVRNIGAARGEFEQAEPHSKRGQYGSGSDRAAPSPTRQNSPQAAATPADFGNLVAQVSHDGLYPTLRFD